METLQNKETLDIANKLVNFCKRGDYVGAVESLYSPDIDSQEAIAMPGMPDHVHGLDAIRKKNKEWTDSMEVHSSQIDGPFPLGDRFAVHFKYDATDRNTKKRMTFDEVALYTVRNGKIIKEEFFYTM